MYTNNEIVKIIHHPDGTVTVIRKNEEWLYKNNGHG